MLTVERLSREVLRLPFVTRIGLAILVLGGFADVAAHLEGAGHTEHLQEHTTSELSAHLIGFVGMVVILLGIVLDGARRSGFLPLRVLVASLRQPTRPRGRPARLVTVRADRPDQPHHARHPGDKENRAMSRKLGLGAIVGTLTASLVLAFAVTATPAADAHSGQRATSAKAAFHDAMRKLWEDHVVWTRQFIVSAATESGSLADIGPTTDRLLANQTDIGNALKPFYGEAAGNQVTALLRDHILTAADIIAAAKAGDEAGVETASAAWYQNADDIATALNSLNPKHWPLAEMKAHMTDHLDLTLEEAVARLQGRYADDIAAYDKIHVQILDMADMLSDGIIAQFPARFAR